jgi:hypothetical protein
LVGLLKFCFAALVFGFLAIFLNLLLSQGFMRRREKESGRAAKIFMSVFLALIMILSVFGIIIGSQSDELKYGKYKFTLDQDNNYYTTKISGTQVYFYTLPFDAFQFNISESVVGKLRSAAFIVTSFDPNTANESSQAIEVVRFDFANVLKEKNVFNAVSAESQLYSSLPVLDCNNATQGMPIVMFNISDRAGVVEAGECIYLNGKGSDFLRLRDALLYAYFGVLDE